MEKVVSFVKRESVLAVSLILAVVSSFFTPSADYLSFIDFKTLALLFCLMSVMAGFKKTGLFDFTAKKLLGFASNFRLAVSTLTLLCFFSSMIITNDVALITFVPFSITTLTLSNEKKLIPITVILQTIAANMGSCLTPIGNPQNIYIFSISNLSFLDFVLLLLPYAAVTLVFLIISFFFIKNRPVNAEQTEIAAPRTSCTAFYLVLFSVSILAVFGIIHYALCLILVIVALLIFDRKTIRRVDYSLLLTFVGFFIFVGNMGCLPAVKGFIAEMLADREILFSSLISQIISNVPAALLLSGFTDNMEALLIGVNIGGLGTLIASMASLISYKYVAAALPDKKGKYLLVFSVLNFALLGIMLLISVLI